MGPIPDEIVYVSNGNEGVFHILQSSKAGALPLYVLVSYTGHSLHGIFPQ